MIPDIPVSKLIQDGAFPVHQLERISSAPVSVFNGPQLELMAFPTLYPNGRNGFGTHRNAKLSPLYYFQTRVMSSDARWARHPSYLFWACNIVEAYKLQSSISIALRLRNPGTQNMNTNKDKDKHEESKEHYLTAGDLKGSSAKENPDVSENCHSFMRDIRGTAAYWQSAKIHLFTMLRSLGTPTFFITFSADDHHWKDLMVVLANCSGRNLTEEQVDLLTDEERRDFMASNPVVTARHFAHRFQCLVKEVIKGSGKPIGEVINFFWRIEFQLRGTPHVHSLWWIKDAPDLDTKAGSQSAPEFIDRYISVQFPDEGCGKDELRSTIIRVQQHKHTTTCQKTCKKKKECRFDFPRPLSCETRLKNNNDVGNKSRFYLLKRNKGEENINAFNIHLLLAWKANMDIQLIGSVYGTASYICSYMCKGESEEVKKAIRDALNTLPANASIRKKLSKVGNTMLSHRELSVQEAAYRLCNLPLKDSTRKVVFVNTVRPEKRIRLHKSRSELFELGDHDTAIFQPGLFDRYAARPKGDDFEEMTLAYFSVWYDTIPREDSRKKDDYTGPGRRSQPRYKLQDNMGWIKLRTKRACLRTPVMTPSSHGDDYYYSLMLLYIPWRQEKADLLQNHETAMAAFIARESELKVLNAQHEAFAEEVQRAVQQLQAVKDAAYMDLVAPNVQHGEREDAKHPTEEADGGLYNGDNFIEQENMEDLADVAPTLLEDFDASGAISRSRLTEKAVRELILSLNAKQREAFEIVVRYMAELHKYHMGTVSSPPECFHLFITGGAGTGKSHLIHAIREHIERSVQGSKDFHGCMVMAPTGVAAFNINGLTIHRALSLQVEHGRSAHQLHLSALALNELRRLWKGVHTIIVDEISMVSYEVLVAVHQKFCEIFATDDIFGGVNVIAVGDLYQLSPVNGHYIFSSAKVQSRRLASHLWKDFFSMIELEDNIRQHNDQSFSSLLNRIRIGDHTQEDIAILATRKTSNNQVDLLSSPFCNALRLFPRVSDCDFYNDQELHKLTSATVQLFEASHVILESRRCTHGAVSYEHIREELIPNDDKECGGLPRRLKLAVGSEIMLRRNIKCGDGLVNGARGIIVGFKWPGNVKNQPSPGALPEYVLIKFHDPRVGQLNKVPIENGHQEVVPIEPMSVRFYGRQGTVLQRTQLPLILCWAATLHKVQGLSLDAAVLDLGEKVFEPGMAYVALSRDSRWRGSIKL